MHYDVQHDLASSERASSGKPNVGSDYAARLPKAVLSFASPRGPCLCDEGSDLTSDEGPWSATRQPSVSCAIDTKRMSKAARLRAYELSYSLVSGLRKDFYLLGLTAEQVEESLRASAGDSP